MRILLLGKDGQLGWELHRSLATLGDVIAFDYPEIDLRHMKCTSMLQLIQEVQPKVIINATAYTAVDQAESEPEAAFAINGQAPGILAELAADQAIALIHFSTDYVFDGTKGSPYLETDPPGPVNIYGQSKLAGEQAILQVNSAYLILRTSWVYSLRRDSFVNKVLKWSRGQSTLRIVTDQVGNPTWARMLAEITAQALAKCDENIVDWINQRKGIYHLAGDGAASRLEWAEAIMRFDPHGEEQTARQILPALTSEFPTPARRPLYSALNCDLFYDVFHLQLPPWQRALQLAMEAA